MNIASYFHKPSSRYCIRVDDGKITPVITYDAEHKKLVRKVKQSHYLYSKKGYAIHKPLLDLMAKQCGESTPLEIVTEKGKTYTAPLEKWQKEGEAVSFSGPQICLPITKMKWGKASVEKHIIGS